MRILSYNIHKGIGGRDRRYALRRVIDVIEAENPDLICLQEVDRNVPRSRHHDQPNLLADYFQAAAHAFQMNVKLQEGGYGNLILSRWKFRSKHQISLKLNWRKCRGAQMVVVETPEGLLHLANVHLGLSDAERHWQIEHLLAHPRFRESLDLPTLLVGDWNDWRNKLTHGPLGEHGFTQATQPLRKFRSFPAYLAIGALDKAFHRGGLHLRAARIVRTAAAKQASDHLPLVIDFHLHA
jgi:endonuclease/exonuclease/phosphatase family metal-dependent hydrolase